MCTHLSYKVYKEKMFHEDQGETQKLTHLLRSAIIPYRSNCIKQMFDHMAMYFTIQFVVLGDIIFIFVMIIQL